MSCINPNDPKFKSLLARVGNPLLAELEFDKDVTQEDSEKVDKIFKKYPELARLFNNNKELYNSYLESIFPKASEEFKGKLFFHGTKNPIEGGKFTISDSSLAKGLWFTKQLGYAKRIQNYKNEEDNPITYGVVLNIKNPKHFYNSSGALLVQRPSDFEKEYDRKNNDAAVFHHPESSDGKFTNEGGYNQVVIFNENQVHIIGDENDMIKAKEFIEGKQSIIKSGVPELFESNPELATIGTPQQYSQYLDTIFPDSKVKDIVYHKTSSKEIEGGKFKISRLGGVYFSFFNVPSGGLLKGLVQKLIKENTIIAVVDVKNPFIVNRNNAKEVLKKIGLTTQDVTKLRKNFDLSTNDAVLGFPNEAKDTGQLDNFPTISFNKQDRKDIIELAVFEPEQIHILGSKQDIEGFKNFIEDKQSTIKPDVILPIGTSGSGKSTFIKSLPQENLVVIEPDSMRVEFTGNMNDKSKDKEIYEEAAKRAIQAIKQGKQVVFDTTNLTKDKRRPFIEAIKKEIPNANIQYKLMELNPELAKQRIKAQLERGENRAVVSDETIDRHAASYKQMLEDIKNEPISEYKEFVSKDVVSNVNTIISKEEEDNKMPPPCGI